MSKDKKGIYRTKVSEVVDVNSGEILSSVEEVERVEWDKEPDFIKLYISDIIRLNNLPPATERVLMIIIRHMGYKNIFQAYKPIKMLIAKELGITLSTMNKSIIQLKKAGILIPMDEFGRGLYLVDPNLFARGRWEDIKQIRLIIEYTANGERRLRSNAAEQIKQLSLF